MPLLSGVMVAGAQEETSCVGADVFRAALWERSFFHSLQTQLGLLVDELAAQLRHKTVTLSQPNSQHVNIHIKVSSPPCLYELPPESADGRSLPGARRQDHPLPSGIKAQSPHGTPAHLQLRV